MDLRTSSNNIVLSDGDGEPRLQYIASNSVWDVYASEGIARFSGPTNDPISVADDGTVTLTSGTAGACLIHVYDQGTGDGAVFFGTYKGATVLVTQSLSNTNGFAITDTDGNFCVFKSGNNHTITFKNRTGATKSMLFMITGAHAKA